MGDRGGDISAAFYCIRALRSPRRGFPESSPSLSLRHRSPSESDVCNAANTRLNVFDLARVNERYRASIIRPSNIRTVNYPNHRRYKKKYFPITIMNMCIYCGSYVKQLGKFKIKFNMPHHFSICWLSFTNHFLHQLRYLILGK